MEPNQSPTVEKILRIIEAERVRQRLRPLAVSREANLNGGCYSRLMREHGGRISSVVAILNALGLDLDVVNLKQGETVNCTSGEWLPVKTGTATKRQKCSVCGITYPIVDGIYPFHYCPACGSHNLT